MEFGDFGIFDGYAYYNDFYDTYYTDQYEYKDGGAFYSYPVSYYTYYYKPAAVITYKVNSGLSGYYYGTSYNYYYYYMSEPVEWAYKYTYNYGKAYIFGSDAEEDASNDEDYYYIAEDTTLDLASTDYY